MVKTCLGTLLGIICAFLLFSGGCVFLVGKTIENLPKDFPDQPAAQKGRDVEAKPARLVTKAAYDEIQEGMTYEEVVKIIGFDGEEMASNKLDGVPGVMPTLRTKMYMWSNLFGSNMNATFQNNKLVQKAQFGLR